MKRSLKRLLTKKAQIVMIELLKYPDIEMWLIGYELGWISTLLGSYYPTMVCEFYAYYIDILEKLSKKDKTIDTWVLDKVLICGVSIDISK